MRTGPERVREAVRRAGDQDAPAAPVTLCGGELRCTYYGCQDKPVARVSGGLTNGERRNAGRAYGWTGLYCLPHVLGCVDTQLFQVDHDMPIVIEKIGR